MLKVTFKVNTPAVSESIIHKIIYLWMLPKKSC